MNNKEKSKIILRELNKIYPKVPIPLNYKNTFTLLISVLLSAQCTDVNVNNVTKNIYPKYNQPKHFVKLGRKKIERLINKIGIFRIKAKSIYFLSKTLVEKYKSKVPKTYEELESLPGVSPLFIRRENPQPTLIAQLDSKPRIMGNAILELN